MTRRFSTRAHGRAVNPARRCSKRRTVGRSGNLRGLGSRAEASRSYAPARPEMSSVSAERTVYSGRQMVEKAGGSCVPERFRTLPWIPVGGNASLLQPRKDSSEVRTTERLGPGSPRGLKGTTSPQSWSRQTGRRLPGRFMASTGARMAVLRGHRSWMAWFIRMCAPSQSQAVSRRACMLEPLAGAYIRPSCPKPVIFRAFN